MQTTRWRYGILLFLLIGSAIDAQDEPLGEALKENFKKSYLSVGMLLQTVGDFQGERTVAGNNGFNISNFRLSLRGELDRGFAYFVQANFIASPAILDARLSYRLSPGFTLDAGQFKVPFSKEFLTTADAIDFVNRSQVVAALVPGRDIGVQLRSELAGPAVTATLGGFNGNRSETNNNDNGEFLYAGRLALAPSSGSLELGVNAAYSRDRNATVAGESFRGKRFLAGGDIRWQEGPVLLAGEYIYASLKSSGAEINPAGFHATAGYMVAQNQQLLFRFDSFRPDGQSADSDQVIFGYNLWPTSLSEVQVNYIVNPDDNELKHHQVLLNFQVAF